MSSLRFVPRHKQKQSAPLVSSASLLTSTQLEEALSADPNDIDAASGSTAVRDVVVERDLSVARQTPARVDNRIDHLMSKITNYSTSAAQTDRRHVDLPRGIEFTMLTEREVRAQSVVDVVHQERILMLDDIPQPLAGGLIDEHMGPAARSSTCLTCGGIDNYDYYLAPNETEGYSCPGHFGKIELPGALFNPEFIITIVHLLRSFCWFCGYLPGTKTQNAEVIRSLLARDAAGKPLSRDKRLALLYKAYKGRRRCDHCFGTPERRAAIRCERCSNENDEQCGACSGAVQFRPVLVGSTTKIGRRLIAGEPSLTNFPYIIGYDTDGFSGSKSDSSALLGGKNGTSVDKHYRARSLFDNFVARNELRNLTLELTGERARKIFERIDWRLAALLMPHLPDESFGDLTAPKGTLRRAFGCLDDEKKIDIRSDFITWTSAMVPRVIPVAPNCVRPTRFAGGYSDPTWNELTNVYWDLIGAKRKLVAHVRHIISDFADKEHLLMFRSERANVNRHTGAQIVIRRGERWCDQSAGDQLGVPELYAMMQFYFVILINPAQAKHYIPRGASIVLPAKARRDAANTKNRGRSLAGAHKGKGGTWRLNVMGKRVDFSARTVIDPDPTLEFDQVGLPYELASKLTRVHTLCALNIEALLRRAQRCIDGTEPGIGAICRDSQPLLMNDDCTQAIAWLNLDSIFEHPLARVGSKIDMFLGNDDVIIINRAPSLHRASIMAHRVRLTDTATLQLPLSVTGPYNADFDGDEMTIHVPQSLQAIAEARELMMPSSHIMLPKSGTPCIGLVQDHLLMSFVATRREIFLDRGEFTCMWMQMNGDFSRIPMPAIILPHALWTVRQLMSALLPPTLTLRTGKFCAPLYNLADRSASDAHAPSLIVGGVFHYGEMTKSLSGAIVKAIMTGATTSVAGEAGAGAAPERATDAVALYINGMTALTTALTSTESFSIGIDDVVPDSVFRISDRGPGARCNYVGPAPDVFDAELGELLAREKTLADRLVSLPDSASRDGVTAAQRALDAKSALQKSAQTLVDSRQAATDAECKRAITAIEARKSAARAKELEEKRNLLAMSDAEAADMRRDLCDRLYTLRSRPTWNQESGDIISRLQRADERESQEKKLEAQLAALNDRASRHDQYTDSCQLCSRRESDIVFADADTTYQAALETARDQHLARESLCEHHLKAIDTFVDICSQTHQQARHEYLQLQESADQLQDAALSIEENVPNTHVELCAALQRLSLKKIALRDELVREGATQFIISRIVAECKPHVDKLIADAQNDWRREVERGSDKRFSECVDKLESSIIAACTDARNKAHQAVFRSLHPDNSFRVIVLSGSKGALINAGEIMAFAGQQTRDGRRTADSPIVEPDSVDSDDPTASAILRRVASPSAPRYLPHDRQIYPGASAGGAVFSSLIRGVTPQEFMHSADGTRGSLVKTAVATAGVGYLSRRMIKSLEDQAVDQLGNVRTGHNKVLQTRVGGTGYDPAFVQQNVLPPLLMSDEQFAETALISVPRDVACFSADSTAETASTEELDAEFGDLALLLPIPERALPSSNNIILDDERSALFARERRDLVAARDFLRARGRDDFDGRLNTVCDIEAILTEITYGSIGCSGDSVKSSYVESASPCWSPCIDNSADATAYAEWRDKTVRKQLRLQVFITDEPRALSHNKLEELLSRDDNFARRSTLIDEARAVVLVDQFLDALPGIADSATRAQLRLRLCAKQLVRRHMVSEASLVEFFDCYRAWLRRAVNVCGDAVAITATQSFSIVGMQLTLSSFHAAGHIIVCVTEGMPRALELVNATSTEKMLTPVATVFARRGGSAELRAAQRYVSSAAANAIGCDAERALCAAWTTLGRDRLGKRLADLLEKSRSVRLDAPPAKPTSKLARVSAAIPTSSSSAKKRKRPSVKSVAKLHREQLARKDHEQYSAACSNRLRKFNSECERVLSAALDAFDEESPSCATAPTLDTLCVADSWRVCTDDEEFVRYSSSQGISRMLEEQREQLDRAEYCVLVAQVASVHQSMSKNRVDYALHCIWEHALQISGWKRGVTVFSLCSDSAAEAGVGWTHICIAVLNSDSAAGAEKVYSKIRQRRQFMTLHTLPMPPPNPLSLGMDSEDEQADDALFDSSAMKCFYDIRRELTERACNGAQESSDELDEHTRKTVDIARLGPLITTLKSERLKSALRNWHVVDLPLRVRAGSNPDDESKELEIVGELPADASDEERMLVEMHYGFAPDGCERDTCVDTALEHAHVPDVQSKFSQSDRRGALCLSSYVLIMRFDRLWLRLADYDTARLTALLERSLGDQYSVIVGDENGNDYLPVHVRLHTCQLDELRARKDIADSVVHEIVPSALVDCSMLPEERAKLSVDERRLEERRIRAERENGAEFPLDHPFYTHELQRARLANLAEPITREEITQQYWRLFKMHQKQELLRTFTVLCDTPLLADLATDNASPVDLRYTAFTPEKGGEENCVERALLVTARDFRALLNTRGIDRRRSWTNSIRDTVKVRGLAAARDRAVQQYRSVVESSSLVHHTHLALIADTQMMSGEFTPFTIFGAQKNGVEPIQAMTFERSGNMISRFTTACARNKFVQSPSSCIAIGAPLERVGTQTCTVLSDMQAYIDASMSGMIFPQPELSGQIIFQSEIAQSQATHAALPFGLLDGMFSPSAQSLDEWTLGAEGYGPLPGDSYANGLDGAGNFSPVQSIASFSADDFFSDDDNDDATTAANGVQSRAREPSDQNLAVAAYSPSEPAMYPSEIGAYSPTDHVIDHINADNNAGDVPAYSPTSPAFDVDDGDTTTPQAFDSNALYNLSQSMASQMANDMPFA